MVDRKVGIIGASGFIGSEVINKFKNDFEIFAPIEKQLDITKAYQVDGWMKSLDANTIFLLAAYTDVKGAQESPKLARKINVGGVKNVADSAKRYNKHVVYISTGFVFTGKEDFSGPYGEEDDPRKCDPRGRGVYAETKLEGEEILIKIMGLKGYTIVRIDFPYGNEMFPAKDYIIKLINQAKVMPLFDDQKITPTYISDLIDVLKFIAEKKIVGILHVTSHDVTTPYELGRKAIELLGLSIEVRESSVFDYVKKQEQEGKQVLWPLTGGLKVNKVEKIIRRNLKTTDEALQDFAPRLKKVFS